ncbi:MAG: hypothetical protein HYX74_11115 [Acidobacteria bacterium]|nr:hypothetical protein [Acidobacteriota bacterium]
MKHDWTRPLPLNRRFLLLLLPLLALEAGLFWKYTSEFLTPDGIFYLSRRLDSPEALWKVFAHLDDVHNYRPLTYVMATPLYWMAGLDPFPYHLAAILFHAANTLLVFWFSWLVLRSEAAALASAFFVGLHGAASRVAFGISFLSDLSYLAFYVLALISFVKSERAPPAARRWYLLSLVFFLLSLLCKEPAVTLPAALLLALTLVAGLSPSTGYSRYPWRRALVRTAPFWLVAVLYLGWFGWLTKGSFVPENPDHPYEVSFSMGTLLEKHQYLRWGFNLPGGYATMADHPSISAMAQRLLPAEMAAGFGTISDFYLYLIGPVWALWLVVTGKAALLPNVAAGALLTPLLLVSLLILARSLFRSWAGSDKTAWFGILFFLLGIAPVLFLAKKTMLHNLYLPVVGLGLVVGTCAREWGLQSARARTTGVLAALVLVTCGINNIISSLRDSWPVTTSRKAQTYLEDLQRLYPKLPAGAILYFEKTGDPDWPWLVDVGNLYRLYYRDPSLVTLFGDYGQPVPQAGPAQTLLRLCEVNGHLTACGQTDLPTLREQPPAPAGLPALAVPPGN